MERPYTRQSLRKPRKGYVKGVPEIKIHRFEMGNVRKKFPVKMSLISESHIQVRHNALEAARMAAHKVLVNGVGEEGYFMKVLIYPFHVLRENPLATGAGADRFSSGMRLSFGHPIGTAAQIKNDQNIISVWVETGKEEIAKRALKIASYKLPGKYRIN